jgi:hypothetical protein
MNPLNHPDDANRRANAAESNADALVCSAEFKNGCADPQVGAPPKLQPCAPIPEVQPRPQGTSPAEAVRPAPVATHNMNQQPEAGFPESACSAEFPQGCVNPAEAEP